MVCRAGRGEEDTMWSELSWWVEEQGRGRNGAVPSSTWEGGRRRLAWRAGDACAMNQLSKYGPCCSLQHTHPLPAQSGWTSPLPPVYLLLLLSHVHNYTLLSAMEEACQVKVSHILTAPHVLLSATGCSSMHINTFRTWAHTCSSQSLSLDAHRSFEH